MNDSERGIRWPEIRREMRPWAYHWWLGSAVDEENLAREHRRYRAGGLGGLHIVPIYGAKGAEDRFIPHLSDQWMRMLEFAIAAADQQDLGIDLTTGSGWCFGGPNITPELSVRKWVVGSDGKVTHELVERMVKRAAPGAEGRMLNPFFADAMRTHLKRFTAAFDRPGTVMPRAMYHDSYEYAGGNWSPNLPDFFAGHYGYRIEDEAEALAGQGDPERTARVWADYREALSLMMLETFGIWRDWCRTRGMLTRNQAHGTPANLLDFYAIADIPETEMFGRGGPDPLVSRFDEYIGAGARDVLVSKFASSAAHVTGKPLVASETCTWLAEHFCETYEEMKCEVDLMFLAGVNHVFYHGCVYSPDDAAWPGWLFYASTQMNPRNPLWREAPALNEYIARCQSILQEGLPDNDLLLYWPVHDTWREGTHFGFGVADRGWLHDGEFGRLARELWAEGYGFDYVSDVQLQGLVVKDGQVQAPGGARYQTLVVPSTRYLPVATLELLLALAKAGALIIFDGQFPEDVPGLGHLDAQRAQFKQSTAGLDWQPGDGKCRESRLGQGRLLVAETRDALAAAGVRPEPLVQAGAMLVRRVSGATRHYFVVNHGLDAMQGWFGLTAPAQAVYAMNPLNGAIDLVPTRRGPKGDIEVYMRLEPGHSLILKTADQPVDGEPVYPVLPGAAGIELAAPWRIEFIAGGPELPAAFTMDKPASWTAHGDPATEAFSGTARYTTQFDVPAADNGWVLDLGRVCHVARVRLNGCDLGALIMNPYRLTLPAGMLRAEGNELEIEVTNLAANRIRDLDRRQVKWKNFHEINFVNIKYKPFDASEWPVFDSGLLGPVTLTPMKIRNP